MRPSRPAIMQRRRPISPGRFVKILRPKIVELLATVRDVLGGDPFQAGLSDEEQARTILARLSAGARASSAMHWRRRGAAIAGQPLSDLQGLGPDAQGLKRA